MKINYLGIIPELHRLAAVLLLAVLSGLAALNASAQLIAYDSMSYSGTQVNAGTVAPSGTPTQTASGGFTGNWAPAAALTWNSSGMTYASLPTTGGSLANLGANNDYEKVASAPTTGSVWVSFLFSFNGTVGGNRNGIMIEDSTGTGVMFCYHQNSGTQAFPCLVPMTSITTKGTELTPDSTTLRTVANSILYVLQFTYTAGTVSRIDVYSAPTANQGTAPSPDFSITTGLPSMGAINIIGMCDSTADPLAYDEVRVGNTFGDVVGYNPALLVPTAPTGLGATPGVNSVALSWTVSANSPVSYNVKRSTTSGGPYTTISTSGAVTGTSYNDSVAGGTTYYYVVSGVNASGEGTNSLEVFATPTLGAPSTPTGLTAIASDAQVSLSWTASLAAASYNVKRSTTSGTEVTITNVSTTSFADTAVANGTTYFYTVSATNAVGESADASEVSSTPVAYVSVYEPFAYSTGSFANNTVGTGTGETGNWTIPTAATIVTPGLTYTGLPVSTNAYQHVATASQNFVNLAASSQMSGGTRYISFLIKDSGDSGGDPVGAYFKGNNATSLFAGFHAANNGVNNGFSLGSVSSTSLGGVTTLGSIINIANSTVHLIVIQIDFNTSGANDTINLWIDPPANVGAPGVGANSTVTTFDVGTISALGINIAGGYAARFDEFRTGKTYGSVVGYNPPTAPTNLVATPGVNTVGLSWDAVGAATGYNVLRGTSTGVYNVTNATASNAYTDNLAVGGTQYFYVVQATNASGSSAFSAEVTATPTIALPNVPAGLTATGTNGAVQLSWSAATGAAGYNVKRSTTTGTEVNIASVGTTSYFDTAVVNGQQYFYKVSSTNSTGESADSSEASATPDVLPATPTGLMATAGNSQVSLSWTGSAGAASYNVKRSTTSGSGYSTVGTTTDPTTAFIDMSAIKFTQYYYVISAVSAYGESSDSSEASATPTGTYGPSAYESFNYTTLANGDASTAAGFTGNWNVSGNANIVAGLTYAGLPTSNNSYSHGAAGAQTTVDFANSLSSGTKYISFLFQGSGNPGANTCGVFLKGNNADSLFAGFEGGFSPTQTSFGIGTVSSTALGGATVLGSTTPIDNTTVHLVVVEIDFNTSGANDTVSLWIDPPAGVITPGVPANVSNSTFDVGIISAFGININGAFPIGIDEVRVGDVYGDVVGYTGTPPSPPVITSSLVGNQLTLSWPAGNLGWFLQSQTNSLSAGLGTNWADVVGSETDTNSVIAVDTSNPTEFFRLRSP